MKLDSKYFDSIRVNKTRAKSVGAQPAAKSPGCQWKDCGKRGQFRAPKGRDSEGEYYSFCRDHVAEYNKSYNYFSGMKDSEVADYQKSASLGHRPTWSMASNGAKAPSPGQDGEAPVEPNVQDPLEVLRAVRGRYARRPTSQAAPRRRVLHKGAKKHLATLYLDDQASPEEIRAKFKDLVKLHHPDHNGGDRSSEERFREVIAAYNYLKQSGLC